MTKQLTLLESAKQSKSNSKFKHNFTAEDIQLVKAWLNEQIGIGAVTKAKGIKNRVSGYIYVATCCREIWQNLKVRK